MDAMNAVDNAVDIVAAARPLIELAIAEDIGLGDATSEAVLPDDLVLYGRIFAKAEGIIAGLPVAEAVFSRVDPALRFTPHVFGMEIEMDRALEARERALGVTCAVGEALPYDDGAFDVVFSHEVLEHVADDGQSVRELIRVTRPGGRIVIFVPNRLYFFETHGIYWRGEYHFGNQPLVNWLPDVLRNRLAPHVRAYTGRGLRRLCDTQPVRIVTHTQIYPGYDNIVARLPRAGRILQRVTYALEKTPLRVFGLSHFLVLERESL